jgi:chromate reductase
MAALRFLAISGSLRASSLNTAALRAAKELAPDGVTIEIAEIGDIPLYNDDVRLAGMPASVVALQGAIAAADAVLIATPEYNFSIPGVLKNAIDWMSRTDPQPFRGKPVGIIGASMGALGTGRAQYDLRKVFLFLDAHVLNKPEVMICVTGRCGCAVRKSKSVGMIAIFIQQSPCRGHVRTTTITLLASKPWQATLSLQKIKPCC